jgi:hypothetical protein
MNNITIEAVIKIIADIKEKHNISDDKFEIFSLAAVLDELKMEDFYNLSILRASNDTNDDKFSFQIGLPTNHNTFIRYDNDEKKFVTINDRHGHKNSSHAVHTEKEMEVLKDVYNLFENNVDFNDFKNDFSNNLSKKINKEYLDEIEKLYAKHYDFKKLFFLYHLKQVETVDEITDKIDKIDIGLDLFRTGLDQIEAIHNSDTTPSDGVHTAVNTKSLDEKIISRHFESVLQFDNLMNRSINHVLTDDDILKIKQLLKSDYVKNNTLSGIVVDDQLTLSEKYFKIVGLFYEELRADFINSLENVTLLKTREQISANFHIDEIKSRILEEFPTAFNEKNLRAVKSVEIGEFTDDTALSGKRYFEYLRSLKPFGIIRGVDIMTNSNFNINHDAFFEESYSKGKLVTLKSVNEVETLYQYTFKEFDVYGVKLLEPKDVYISKECLQSHHGFNDSLRDLIKYAKENQCILVTSEKIDDNILFTHFGDHLSNYEYENVVFYDRGEAHEKNHLNITLGLQKEFGKKMTFDDHIKIKEYIESKAYIDTDSIIEKAKEIINSKKEKKLKINGPS